MSYMKEQVGKISIILHLTSFYLGILFANILHYCTIADRGISAHLGAYMSSRNFSKNWGPSILRDPEADKGGEGKSKRVEKYIWNEEK